MIKMVPIKNNYIRDQNRTEQWLHGENNFYDDTIIHDFCISFMTVILMK